MSLSIPQKRAEIMINFIHNTLYKLKSELVSGCIRNTCRLASEHTCFLLLFAALWEMFHGSNDNFSENLFRYRCLDYLYTGDLFGFSAAGCVPAMKKTARCKVVSLISQQLFSMKSNTEIFSPGESPQRVSLLYRHCLF